MKTLISQPEISSKKKAALSQEGTLSLNAKQTTTNNTTTTYIKSSSPLYAKRKVNPKLYIL